MPRYSSAVILRALQRRDRHRPAADLAPSRAAARTRRRGRSRSATTSNTPLPVAPIARAMPEQLVGGGGEARRGAAVRRAVGDRARRREAERAGLDRLGGEAAHRRRSRRRSAPRRGRRRGRPSRSRAARRAAPARRSRSRAACGRSRRGTRGSDSQPHVMPSCERGAGDVLDALHQLDQPVVPVGAHRREPHAAVAHDGRRDAVPRRRREQRVPRDLAVVVRVHVDPTRGDEQAVGVDLVAPATARRRRPR